MESCCSIFSYVGAAVLGAIVIKFLWIIYDDLKTYVFGGEIDFKSLGQWAVITGATDGIGKSYAKELARRGMNIVLLSRTFTKLQDVAKEIESEFRVKTKVISVDFTGDLEIYSKIKDELKDLDIGVLVNNVGVAESNLTPTHTLPQQITRDMIVGNCLPVTLMTQMILPAMIKKNKGAIVNVASGGAMHPCPFITIYSASKAYVDFFTRALQVEVSGTNVIIQDLLPYFVATSMLGMKTKYFFLPDADTYVKSAIKTIGRQSYSFGCLFHAFQGHFAAIIPTELYMRVVFPAIAKGVDWLKSKEK